MNVVQFDDEWHAHYLDVNLIPECNLNVMKIDSFVIL